jgi:hypothetical protein
MNTLQEVRKTHVYTLVKGKIVPVLLLTEHHAMKVYWGSGGIVPRILDLGTRWR